MTVRCLVTRYITVTASLIRSSRVVSSLTSPARSASQYITHTHVYASCPFQWPFVCVNLAWFILSLVSSWKWSIEDSWTGSSRAGYPSYQSADSVGALKEPGALRRMHLMIVSSTKNINLVGQFCLSPCLSICLSVCLFACLSVHLYAYYWPTYT